MAAPQEARQPAGPHPDHAPGGGMASGMDGVGPQPSARLLDALGDIALFELTSDGHVRRWTAPARRLFGYAGEDIVGQPFACLHASNAIAEGVPGRWLDLAQREGRAEASGWMRRRDGSVLFGACVMVFEPAGMLGPGGFAVSCRDCTSHYAAEEQARLAVERVRVLADAVQGQVACELSLGGEVRYWNADAEAMTGHPAGEVAGQPFLALCHRDDAEAYRHALETARATGHWEGEMRLLRRDGPMLRCHARLALVRDAAGCPAALAWTARDVGPERRMEALEGETRRVQTFLAILAHELRNPLAPIGNAVDVIRLSEPPDLRIRHCTEIIGRQFIQLSRLVNDLLDFGRITAGKLAVERVPAQYQEIVSGSVETMRPVFDEAGLSLSASLPATPLWIEGDPSRLGQVLCNLLGNAVRYTPRGGAVTLRVTAADSRVVTELSDTGRGISANGLERIFELFAQEGRLPAEGREGGEAVAMNGANRDTHTSTNSTMNSGTHIGTNGGIVGLGIGLALARAVVEAHGGGIRADSAGPGQGSTFTMTLPLAHHPHQAAHPDHGATAGEPAIDGTRAIPVTASRVQRVLVIDDNADSADSMADLLCVLGHEGRAAYSGGLALAVAVSFRPDCILLDLEMPGQSGYDVLAALRATEEGRAMRVYALTGRGTAEDRQRTHAAGFDGHLVKPVSLAALTELLRR